MFADVNLKYPIVLMNGVMIYDPVEKDVLSCSCIDNHSAQEILKIYEKHNISPLVYFFKNNHLEIEYTDTDNMYQMAYVNKRTEASGKVFVYSPVISVNGKKTVYIGRSYEYR